jgi:hypothetical protein
MNMSNAKNETKATGRTVEDIAGDDAFERLYSNWLAARANLYNPDEAPSSMGSRLDRVSEAATALLVTPSTLPWMVWQKWEVLDDYLDTEKQDGVFSDNRTVVALACIKADLMRLGIANRGEG